MKEANLAWLGCAIDSEGSITVRPQKVKRKSGIYITYRPIVHLINTHNEYLDFAREIIESIGASYKLYTREYEYDSRYKSVKQVQVYGKQSVHKILTNIYPWLFCKKAFAHDMINALEVSLKRGRAPQPQHEIDEWERIRIVHMPRSKSALRANGETYGSDTKAIPCQAKESAKSTLEGVETSSESAQDNKEHKRPGTSFPVRGPARYTISKKFVI